MGQGGVGGCVLHGGGRQQARAVPLHSVADRQHARQDVGVLVLQPPVIDRLLQGERVARVCLSSSDTFKQLLHSRRSAGATT